MLVLLKSDYYKHLNINNIRKRFKLNVKIIFLIKKQNCHGELVKIKKYFPKRHSTFYEFDKKN